MNEHTCPVCGYDALEFPPRDYSICACCGTEFGYDDRALTHDQLRAEWMGRGCAWFDVDGLKPAHWNAYDQLVRAALIPRDQTNTATHSSGSVANLLVLHVEPNIRIQIGHDRELELV